MTAMWTRVWNSSRRTSPVQDFSRAQALQLLPGLDAAIDVIEHEAEEDQPGTRFKTARMAARVPTVSSRLRNVSRYAKPTAKKNWGMMVSA